MAISNITIDAATSALRASASQALAEALICGIDECEQEGYPLTQIQKIQLAKMAVMSYDKILEGCSNMKVDLSIPIRWMGND